MDDEFKLCWKNFQDNIATGFQSLYDRGDLVDVTLACDGKLLQAHKFVLAICSPYFQEIFISNPCKHPIIILKDVSYNIMCELLEFMYQGVVNVKHTELHAFMKIGQLLQIKGLATNSQPATSTNSDISSGSNNQTNTVNEENSFAEKASVSATNKTTGNEENSNTCGDKQTEASSRPNTPQRSHSPTLSPAASPMQTNSLNANQTNKLNNSQLSAQQSSSHDNTGGVSGQKRHIDYNSDTLSVYSRNKLRRSINSIDLSSENTEGPDGSSVNSNIEQMNTEDFFLPHISMVESRYELNNVKRESSEHHQNSNTPSAAAVAAASLRNSFNSATFGLDYAFYKNNSSSQPNQEFPNELHMSNEYPKTFANHMDIPPNCPNVVMLSSTSLLHGNCVFNRNNTVATQQGMKTYWLCKSYRISMCRARCITHQGKIISATGTHNHAPHMRGSNNTSNSGNAASSGNGNSGSINTVNYSAALTAPAFSANNLMVGHTSSSLRYSQNSSTSGNSNNQNYHDHQHPITPPPQQHHQPFVVHSHVQSSNSNNNAVAPPPHLFLQSMPNLLVQHYPSGQTVQGMQQVPFPTQHHNVSHSYEISPTIMQSSPSDEHSRNTNSSYDQNDKTLGSMSRSRINHDNIIVQNAAALSPSNVQNNSIKTGHDESLTQQNQIGKKIPSTDHHQVQVIDSITISPSNGQNFKMESM